jgi:hypothetical protein
MPGLGTRDAPQIPPTEPQIASANRTGRCATGQFPADAATAPAKPEPKCVRRKRKAFRAIPLFDRQDIRAWTQRPVEIDRQTVDPGAATIPATDSRSATGNVPGRVWGLSATFRLDGAFSAGFPSISQQPGIPSAPVLVIPSP